MIATGEQLAYLAQEVNKSGVFSQGKYYKLTANIVLNDTSKWTEWTASTTGLNKWTPIGKDATNSFLGKFNGDGHTVSGMYINDASSGYIGLFGYVLSANTYKADVNNLGVINSYISCKSYGGSGELHVGGVVGSLSSASINNCYNTGAVNVDSDKSIKVGGIAGYNGGYIVNCYNTGALTASSTHADNFVGGIVGYSDGGIDNIYNRGNVTGKDCVGGVVGRTIRNIEIKTCYNSGKVASSIAGATFVGGVVGNDDGSRFSNCYFLTGQITIGGEPQNPEKASGSGTTAGFGRFIADGTLTSEIGTIIAGETVLVEALNVSASKFGGLKWAAVPGGYPKFKSGGNVTITWKYPTAVPEKPFSGGDGSVGSPYLISTPQELANMSYLINNNTAAYNGYEKYYKLTADIILNDTASWENWDGNIKPKNHWIPIGNATKNDTYKFKGSFDGDGHFVSGIYIHNENSYPDDIGSNQGLFGAVYGRDEKTPTEIKNVGVINSYIYSCFGNNVGGVVGNNEYGKSIINCYNTGNVTSTTTRNNVDANVGGVVGNNGSGKLVINCYNTGNVNGTKNNVGGVVGKNTDNGKVLNCYNSGAVNGKAANVGGVVGVSNTRGYEGVGISNCYNSGAVTGTSSIGGVVGVSSTMTNCYFLKTGSINNGLTSRGENNTTATCGTFDSIDGVLTAESGGSIIGGNTNLLAALKAGAEAYNTTTPTPTIKATNWVTVDDNYPTVDDATYAWYTNDKTLTTFEISTARDLKGLSNLVNGTYKDVVGLVDNTAISFKDKTIKLTKDIVLNDTSNWENWETSKPTNVWKPIGTYKLNPGAEPPNPPETAIPFEGTFDGDGHTVSGVYINSTRNNQGLFGSVKGSTIKNLGVVNSYIKGKINVGGIVGTSVLDAKVVNCYNTGAVNGTQNVGGIAGQNGATVANCYNQGSVTFTDANNVLTWIGGVAGLNHGAITNCYNTGNVYSISNNPGSRVGGVVGNIMGAGATTNCYFLKNSDTNIALTAVGGVIATATCGTFVGIDGKLTVETGALVGDTLIVALNAGSKEYNKATPTPSTFASAWFTVKNNYPNLIVTLTINGSDIYANGLAITLKAGATAGVTNIYYDKDLKNNGQNATPIDLSKLDGSTFRTAKDYDLSTYTVYGGGRADATIGIGVIDLFGDTSVTMKGGKVTSINGGGNGAAATVAGSATVTISGGTITGNVVGGGTEAAKSTVTGAKKVNISGNLIIGAAAKGIIINGGTTPVANGVDSFIINGVLDSAAKINLVLPSGYGTGTVATKDAALTIDVAKFTIGGEGATHKELKIDTTGKELLVGIKQDKNAWTTTPSIAGWTFGAAASEPTAAANFGTPTYSYYSDNSGSIGIKLEAQPTNAGTYWLKATVTAQPEYAGLEENVKFTIARKSVTKPTIATAQTYSGAIIVGINDVASGVGYTIVGEWQAADVSTAMGGYLVTFELGGNYCWGNDTNDLGDVTINWNITPLTATLEWSKPTAADLIYDGNAKVPTATVTNLVSPDTCEVLVALNGGDNTNVGTFTYKASALGNSNYALPTNLLSGDYTITKRPVTITAGNGASVYGEEIQALTSSVTTGTLVNGADLGMLGATTTATKTSNVGNSYTTTATFVENNNYIVTLVGGTYEITKRSVTITAGNGASVYGEEIQALTSSVTTGTLVNGTDLGTLGATTTATKTSNVGNSYTTTAAYTANNNYVVTLVGGTYTITARPITITANPMTKVYGEIDPKLTHTITSGDLVSPDTLTGELSRATGENVGTYAITSTLANPNYKITFAGANLTITQKALTADMLDIHQGGGVYNGSAYTPNAQVADGSLTITETSDYTVTWSYAPFVVGTVDDGKYINAGTYTATVDATNGNYSGSVSKSFKITQKALTVTAKAHSITYGAAPSENGFTTDGLLVVDNKLLNGKVTFTNTYKQFGDVGTYTITPVISDLNNYSITRTTGILTVNPKAITVKADDKTSVYGASLAELTFSSTAGDIVNGDTIELTYTKADGTNATTYAISGVEATESASNKNKNYVVTVTAGTYTITSKELSVNWVEPTFTYTGSVQLPTASVTTGVGSETVALTITATSGDGKSAGGHTATAAMTTANGNYTLAGTTKGYTIALAALTDTTTAQSFVYDKNAKTFVASATAFGDQTIKYQYGETAGTYADTPISITDVGQKTVYYKITAPNHAELTGSSTIAIAKAQLTVSVVSSSITKVYNGNNETTVDLVVNGLQTGEAAKATGKATFDTANFGTGKTITVTDITITHTIGTATNYEYKQENLTTTGSITACPITITIDDKTSVFGATTAALTWQDADKAIVNSDNLNIALTKVEGTNVGTYNITGAYNNTNYDVTFKHSTKTQTFGEYTITRKGVAMPTKVATAQTYNGAELTGIDGVVANAGYTIAGDYHATNVKTGGDYSAIFTLDGNHCWTTDTTGDTTAVTITWNILPLAATLEWTAPANLEYDRTEKVPTVKVSNLVSQGATKDTCAVTAGLTSGSNVNVGTFTYTATALDNANYVLSGTLTKDFTITARPITITADAVSKVYGTTTDPELTYKITSGSLVSPDKLDGVLSRAAGENVGTYAITSTLANSNYAITFNSANLTITRQPIAIPTIENKPYTGQEQACGLVDTTEYKVGGTIVGTNRGDYTAIVTPTGNYMWNDGINPELARDVKWSITNANPTVSVTIDNVVYGTIGNTEYDFTTTDGGLTSKNYIYTATGVGSDSTSLAGTIAVTYTAKFDEKSKAGKLKAGDYIANWTFKPNDTTNYTEAIGTQTFKVTQIKLAPAIIEKTITKVYDGTTTATVARGDYSLGGLIDKDVVALSEYASAYASQKVVNDKGLNNVTVTYGVNKLAGADAGNYLVDGGTLTYAGAITAKPLDVVWDTTAFTYNGVEQKHTASVVTGISGESVPVAVAVTIGNGIDATAAGATYTETASIADTNYSLINNITNTYSIAQKEVSIVPTLETITYGDTEKLTGIFDGVTVGEITEKLTVKYTTNATTNTVTSKLNAGTFDITEVALSSVAGNQEKTGNYVLKFDTAASGTGKLVVNKKTLTVAAVEGAVVTKSFDGSTVGAIGSIDSTKYVISGQLEKETPLIEVTAVQFNDAKQSVAENDKIVTVTFELKAYDVNTNYTMAEPKTFEITGHITSSAAVEGADNSSGAFFVTGTGTIYENNGVKYLNGDITISLSDGNANNPFNYISTTLPFVDGTTSITFNAEQNGFDFYLKKKDNGVAEKVHIAYCIDKTIPTVGAALTIKDTSDTSKVFDGYFNSNAVTVSIPANDELSGLDAATTTLTKDGNAVAFTYANKNIVFNLVNDIETPESEINGTYILTVSDNAQNKAAAATFEIAKHDFVKPTIGVNIVDGKHWLGATTLNFKFADDNSGVKSIEYTLDGKAVGAVTKDTTEYVESYKDVNGKVQNGKHVITVKITDTVGNYSTYKSTVYIDTIVDEYNAIVDNAITSQAPADILAAEKFIEKLTPTQKEHISGVEYVAEEKNEAGEIVKAEKIGSCESTTGKNKTILDLITKTKEEQKDNISQAKADAIKAQLDNIIDGETIKDGVTKEQISKLEKDFEKIKDDKKAMDILDGKTPDLPDGNGTLSKINDLIIAKDAAAILNKKPTNFEQLKNVVETYEKLTDKQKAYAESLKTTTTPPTTFAQEYAENKALKEKIEAFEKAVEKITSVTAENYIVGETTPITADSVKDLVARYDEFVTNNQDIFLKMNVISKVESWKNLKTKLDKLESDIASIPSPSPTEFDKTFDKAVDNAKTQFDGLNNSEKDLLTKEAKDKLNGKIADNNGLKDKLTSDAKTVNEIEKEIAKLDNKSTAEDIAKVKENFDKLNDTQKGLVTNQDKLTEYVTNNEAVKDLIKQIQDLDLSKKDLTFEEIKTIVEANKKVTVQGQKDIINNTVGEKLDKIIDIYERLEDAKNKIESIPTSETNKGGCELCDPTGTKEPQHDTTKHLVAIEDAKIAIEKLSTSERELLGKTLIDKINSEYDNLKKYLEKQELKKYIKDKAEDVDVYVYGLATKVDLSGVPDIDTVEEVTVSVNATKTETKIQDLPEGKENVVTYNVKLLAKAGNNLPYEVQPTAGQTVVVKLPINAGIDVKAIEIYHISDNGNRVRVENIKFVVEDNTTYAIFGIESFSEFAIINEKKKVDVDTSDDGSSGSISGGAILDRSVENEIRFKDTNPVFVDVSNRENTLSKSILDAINDAESGKVITVKFKEGEISITKEKLKDVVIDKKSYTYAEIKALLEKPEVTPIPTPTPTEKPTEPAEPTAKKCWLCGACPMFLGLCLWIWLAIAVVAVAVVVFIVVKKKKKNDKK